MFCTNCGLKGAGNFCAGCGTRLAPNDGIPDVVPVEDWQNESCYAKLMKNPEVRERLAAIRSPEKRMTGEEWLGLCDKVFKPMNGVSMKTVAEIAAPIYAKIGIKTGKNRMQIVREPIGVVMVNVLSSLARNGLPLIEAHQGRLGCVIEAKLPSDLWSFEGKLIITVERVSAHTMVEAATTIPGQWFDWGKSTRCLQTLFDDVRSSAA